VIDKLTTDYDVIIIGAGPSGAVAGAILIQQGLSVLIIEKQYFPRFSIGESLLPQCMAFLKQAQLDHVVDQYAEKFGFQFKNGAAFHKQGCDSKFNFTEKFSAGPGTTYQVKRADFDKLLADETESKGVEIRYGHQVNKVNSLDPIVSLQVADEQAQSYQVSGKFLLDGSGFGRVIPRLLNLEVPSMLPMRQSFFSHIKDNISNGHFDRNKILITVHPQYHDVWYWLIPFSDGTASIGVVGLPERFNDDLTVQQRLFSFIKQDPNLNSLLKNARFLGEGNTIKGYSSDVTSLYGKNYALLGNAGEFLDPVFSSGVTIAMKSAVLAAPLVAKQITGYNVDWHKEYSEPLKFGVETFKVFVNAWYDGSFQDVVFYDQHNQSVCEMLSSILAGYAWDDKNPFVAKSKRRLSVLAEVCQG